MPCFCFATRLNFLLKLMLVCFEVRDCACVAWKHFLYVYVHFRSFLLSNGFFFFLLCKFSCFRTLRPFFFPPFMLTQLLSFTPSTA